MILFVLFLCHFCVNGQLFEAPKKKRGHSFIEQTIESVESLGKWVVLGKVSLFDADTREKLDLAASLVQKDFIFFEDPLKGVSRIIKNTIYAEKGADEISFTEKREIGITSQASLEILPRSNQEPNTQTKDSALYPLLNNRFAHAYHTKEKPNETRIDIYEKSPFIKKMCCTEFTIVPEGYCVSYITPESIAIMELKKAAHIVFKDLAEPGIHGLLTPFSAIIAQLSASNSTIVIRALSFAQNSNLVAVLLKLEKLCTILVGHRAAKNLPILQINPPKECHACAWDAEETGLITNACYYKYPFALGLIKALSPQSVTYQEAEQITLHGLPEDITTESSALKKAEMIINQGT